MLVAKNVFEKYKSQITEDQYIVGITDHGTVLYSSWAEMPHQLGVELALAPTGQAYLHGAKVAGYVNTSYIPIPDDISV